MVINMLILSHCFLFILYVREEIRQAGKNYRKYIKYVPRCFTVDRKCIKKAKMTMPNDESFNLNNKLAKKKVFEMHTCVRVPTYLLQIIID